MTKGEALQQKTTRVAILGFGTVGSAVAQLLRAQNYPNIELAQIYNRDIERKRTSAAAQGLDKDIIWTGDIEDVLNSDNDVVIETIGGLDPIGGWLERALNEGMHVVTANKQLIAYRGPALAEVARQNKRALV